MTESSFKVRDSILNEIKKSKDAKGFRVLLSRPPSDEYIDIMAPYLFGQRYNLSVDYQPEKREEIWLCSDRMQLLDMVNGFCENDSDIKDNPDVLCILLHIQRCLRDAFS